MMLGSDPATVPHLTAFSAAALYSPAPSIFAPSNPESKRHAQILRQPLEAGSEYYKLLEGFAEVAAKLSRVAKLKQNWNSYGAEPPDAAAIATTRKILGYLREANFLPRQLVS